MEQADSLLDSSSSSIFFFPLSFGSIFRRGFNVRSDLVEMARKMQEEWEGEEERNRIAEEIAANEALIRNFDDIKERIEADRLHHTHFLLINQVALNWIMRTWNRLMNMTLKK
ncbi:hypothetical protein Tco_1185889 [Tanacetum coccineum]